MGRRSAIPKRSEHAEQSDVIQRAQLREWEFPELALLYAIPNGGKREKRHKQLPDGRWISYSPEGGKLKREGVKPGVPDLCLPAARGGWFGLYIEMKARGGAVSDEQRVILRRLEQQGYMTTVCWDADSAWEVIIRYLEMAPTAWAEKHTYEGGYIVNLPDTRRKK